MQICPVCNTQNDAQAINCKTCYWQLNFPKDHPNYAMVVMQSRQQFQLVSGFNQLFQQMQVQSKVLEKMNFRLDGIDQQVQELKANRPVYTPDTEEVDVELPPLPPITTADSFDIPEKRKTWFQSLEIQWQKVVNACMLRKGEIVDIPTDEELVWVLTNPIIRAVGPRGMHPNLSFELTNLSGLKQLTALETIVVSHHNIDSLKGIEYLSKANALFLHSNKLTMIPEIGYLPQLTQLYINANQIKSILPIKKLTNLTTFLCNYNKIKTLSGITPTHTEKLKNFTPLPNDDLKSSEIKRIESYGIKCKKG